MNAIRCTFLLLLLNLVSTVMAQTPSLATHVYFKHLIGDWTAEGELTKKDGEKVTIKETWTGKATEEGGFLMEGQREMNGNTQSFRWTITRNPATDSFEAVMVTDGKEGEALRFEGHVSEVNLTLELRVNTGANGSITVLDSFKDDTHHILSSNVTFLGDAGETTLSGTITHKRVKAP